MAERPASCPACGGAVLIRSGHACGRQRWRCKGRGRQFTRTTPRGKPEAMRREAVGLYCAGLSLNAVGKRLGVSAQSVVMRWVRDHARLHCPKPEPTGRATVVELDEVWHFVRKRVRGAKARAADLVLTGLCRAGVDPTCPRYAAFEEDRPLGPAA